MNRRNFFKFLALFSVTSDVAVANGVREQSEAVVKVPICVDFLAEWCKEQDNPGYVPREVAWADLDLKTGEWLPCEDSDPIYQHKVANEWWS